MLKAPGHEARTPVSIKQAYYALFVLWLVNVVANIDRFAMGIVIQKVKIDLQLTDTQVGLVTGATFVIAYVAVGIPMARWLDRGTRRTILAWSVGLWSIMMLACGAAQNFVQMALARAGVGAGEAGCIPAAVSLIGDYFRGRKRTEALGIFQSAIAVSTIVGSPIIGIITDHYGWRVALLAFGLAGILLAVLIRLTLVEPVREALRLPAAPLQPVGNTETLARSLRTIFANRAFRYLLISHGIFSIAFFGFGVWYPVSLLRTYGMSYTELGIFMGIVLGIAMLVASVVSGYLCPTVARRSGDERWMAILPAIFCLISVVAMVVASMDLSKPVVLVAGTIAFFFVVARTPPILGLSMELLPASMRSLATVVLVLATNVIGSAIGPIIVGMVSDSATASLGEGPALRQAMLMTMPLFGLAGALLAFLPARFMPRKFAVPA